MQFTRAAVAGLLMTLNIASADNTIVPIGRYSAITVPTTNFENYAFFKNVVMNLNDQATIGDALHLVAQSIGYHYVDNGQIPAIALDTTLPVYQRTLSGTVVDTIRAIAGDSYNVVVDPINRLITVQVALSVEINESEEFFIESDDGTRYVSIREYVSNWAVLNDFIYIDDVTSEIANREILFTVTGPTINDLAQVLGDALCDCNIEYDEPNRIIKIVEKVR